MPKVELTNMCMIIDRPNNRVLVQDRVKYWKGIAFPGGHIDDGEGIVESTIREIREETGLDVSNLQSCGIVNWYNDQTHDRYMVFLFKTETFKGELLDETEEGKVFWVNINELSSLDLSQNMAKYLRLFLDDELTEFFAIYNDSGDGEFKFL